MNIDELTQKAHTLVQRLEPRQAYDTLRDGALLVDTRRSSNATPMATSLMPS